jgi:hypothetical protein
MTYLKKFQSGLDIHTSRGVIRDTFQTRKVPVPPDVAQIMKALLVMP